MISRACCKKAARPQTVEKPCFVSGESPPSRAAISVYPAKAIYNRADTEFSVLPRTIAVRMKLGAGASTSTKNHPRFPEWKTGGFISLGTSLPCLPTYYLALTQDT
jgi:hypothetical protein